jgi:superfamily II DNA or RNA helicase
MDSNIVIEFGSSFCVLQNSNDEIDEMLYRELSYHPEGYFYSPKFQSGVWDGFIRLYYSGRRFKPGFLSKVIGLIEGLGYIVTVSGFPTSTKFVQRNTTYTLRPYQILAVESICKNRFGLIKAPMRSGKTLMFLATVDSERTFPVLFFCRSLDLANQTVERAKQFLPDVSVGLVGDGVAQVGDITIITIQSAFSAFNKQYKVKSSYIEKPLVINKLVVKNLIRSARIVFYDEVHHLVSRTSQFVMDRCINATMKIGLSATPFADREEDMEVLEGIGPSIYDVSWSELIREGYVLRPMIYMYKLPKMVVDGNYRAVYKQAIVDNEFLTKLIVKLAKKLVSMGKSVVVQTELISHTNKLAEELGCPTLTGKDDLEYRTDVIQKLKDKKILCLVSTLFEEGLDIPSLDYTINAAGGLSSISTMQRMRSLTASQDKEVCGIIDFYHQCTYLSKHSRVRRKLYTSEPEFKFTMRDASKYNLEDL